MLPKYPRILGSICSCRIEPCFPVTLVDRKWGSVQYTGKHRLPDISIYCRAKLQITSSTVQMLFLIQLGYVDKIHLWSSEVVWGKGLRRHFTFLVLLLPETVMTCSGRKQLGCQVVLRWKEPKQFLEVPSICHFLFALIKSSSWTAVLPIHVPCNGITAAIFSTTIHASNSSIFGMDAHSDQIC